MKKTITIKTYQRRTKSGKLVTVKQHSTNRTAAEAKADASKSVKGTAKSDVQMSEFKNWWDEAEPGDAIDKKMKSMVGAEKHKAMWDSYNSGAGKAKTFKIVSSERISDRSKPPTKVPDKVTHQTLKEKAKKAPGKTKGIPEKTEPKSKVSAPDPGNKVFVEATDKTLDKKLASMGLTWKGMSLRSDKTPGVAYQIFQSSQDGKRGWMLHANLANFYHSFY